MALPAGACSRMIGPALVQHVQEFHEARPLEEGVPLASARRVLADLARPANGTLDLRSIDPMLDRLVADGLVVRTSTSIALASRAPAEQGGNPLVQQVVEAISSEPAQPPTIKELVAQGNERDAIDAAIRAGLVVRVAPDLVFLPALIDRAREIVARSSGSGITVSAFREALGTSRKYAVPLLEWFDQRGITRRDGDLRFPRSS